MRFILPRVRKRLEPEHGWAIVTAAITMAIMMALGLGAYAFVDGEQFQAGAERMRESSFNLSEGALEAQAAILSGSWRTSASASPSECTESSGATAACPDPVEMAARFDTPDYRESSWTVSVRDNRSSARDAWDDSVMDSNNYAYDQNGDGRLWIHATSLASGRRRTLVAQVERRASTAPVVTYALRSGEFKTTNQQYPPQNVYVQGGGVAVRCTGPDDNSTPGWQISGCLSYTQGQVIPDNVITELPAQPALTQAQINDYRSQAIANGTYSTSCPSNFSGAVRFVEPSQGFTGKCESLSRVNSNGAPGIYIQTRGKLEVKQSFYGAIFLLNLNDSEDDDVFKTAGDAQIFGLVAIDGRGGAELGSNAYPNIVYDGRASQASSTFAGASLRKGTWRELPSR